MYHRLIQLVSSNRTFRWIAVIPGSLLAALSVGTSWNGLVDLIGLENVGRAGWGFFTPLILIIVAARIAPKHKLATAVTASLLFVAVTGAIELFFYLHLRSYPIRFDIQAWIAFALTVVAIFVALKYARPWWERGKLPAEESVT